MTTEELHKLIDYVKECEEALVNWDMDGLAMQTELPILHQHIERLMQESAKTDSEGMRVLLAGIEKKLRDCRNCCLRRTAIKN